MKKFIVSLALVLAIAMTVLAIAITRLIWFGK